MGTSAHILGGKIPFGYNVLLRVPGLLSFKTMFVSVTKNFKKRQILIKKNKDQD
jgi:hypothetical protein